MGIAYEVKIKKIFYNDQQDKNSFNRLLVCMGPRYHTAGDIRQGNRGVGNFYILRVFY
jgi:hypothetical protein